eukprot:SM000283S10695  [mRNA]  locus=s283:24071:25259:+ [translate_table: standard]
MAAPPAATGDGGGECAAGPDAILVLGGGQTEDGGVPVWVQKRLDVAADLYWRAGQRCPIVVLSGGSPMKLPLMSCRGFVVHECASCASYLLAKGVPAHDILKEWGSYDTIANAYFALAWHAFPRKWTRFTLITSEFHMPRSKVIFEWMFNLEGSKWWQGDGQAFEFEYVTASDASIDPEKLQARTKREVDGLRKLQAGHVHTIRTLAQFHKWFHTEYRHYNVADQDDFGIDAKPSASFYLY